MLLFLRLLLSRFTRIAGILLLLLFRVLSELLYALFVALLLSEEALPAGDTRLKALADRGDTRC